MRAVPAAAEDDKDLDDLSSEEDEGGRQGDSSGRGVTEDGNTSDECQCVWCAEA